jgi:hypothetical protein
VKLKFPSPPLLPTPFPARSSTPLVNATLKTRFTASGAAGTNRSVCASGETVIGPVTNWPITLSYR